MINIYKGNEKTGLVNIEEIVDGCWINVIDPNEKEIEWVNSLGIPSDYIIYSLDLDERPRTEKEDDGTSLILIKIPYDDKNNEDIPYETIPLGIIFNEKVLITVCKHDNEILNELLKSKYKGFSTAKKIRFILRILLLAATKYLYYIRQINQHVEAVEDKLQATMRNNEVLDLLKYQKSLVYFQTALKSNELMLERLQKTSIFNTYAEDEDLLEDVLTENQQAIEMVMIAENILATTMNAFGSIISNNLNGVMKFLASVTIVLSIPTIITGFFGMNVDVPLTDQPWGFMVILGILLAICAIVIWIFNRKKWF
jgi:magnesium transporter